RTVPLPGGRWPHVASAAPARPARGGPVAVWQRVPPGEDAGWPRRYHSLDLTEKAFGGEVVITLADGTTLRDEIAVADAHPQGARPFARAQYIDKFRSLADGVLEEREIARFLDAAENLAALPAGELHRLNVLAAPGVLDPSAAPKGLF